MRANYLLNESSVGLPTNKMCEAQRKKRKSTIEECAAASLVTIRTILCVYQIQLEYEITWAEGSGGIWFSLNSL